MRQRGSILLAVVVLFVAKPALAQKPKNSSAVSGGSSAYTISEAYAVYASILEAESPFVVGEVIVNLQTEPYKLCRAPNDELDISIRAAMVDYVRANQSSYILLPIFFHVFPVSKPYRLVLRQELTSVNQGPELGGFLPHIFGARPEVLGSRADLRSFSAVGFNQDKTVALTYYEHSPSGAIRIFQKVNGKWRELGSKAMCGWIS
jgi:hypothetical protein